MRTFDVVVVGLGAMGAAALANVAGRVPKVLGLEQRTPGHEGGSSHGESRVIRLANFENPAYGPLISRALQTWKALEAHPGDIYLRTGILEAGLPRSTIVQGTKAAARALGIEHVCMTPAEVRARFPAITLPEAWEGVFQPDGGIIRADRAIQRCLEAARARGATVETQTRVRSIASVGDGVEIVTDRETISAGAAIIASGPWIAELVPELRPHLTLTRQVLAWFEPRQPELAGPDSLPVFLFESEDDTVYGFPDFAGLGVKAASHRLGPRLSSADQAIHAPGEDDVAPVRQALERLLAPAAGPLRAATTCIYTSTPDEEFVIDVSPGHPRIAFASACSGHGFKFASAIGEILADLALGQAPACDVSAFRLARFA